MDTLANLNDCRGQNRMILFGVLASKKTKWMVRLWQQYNSPLTSQFWEQRALSASVLPNC
jgi:hypothetical protein